MDDSSMHKFKQKMKRNRGLKKRVQWFMLGQRRCHCCGVQMTWDSDGIYNRSASVEHIIPASMGGTYHNENILITCRKCNSDRGTEHWVSFVERNNFPKKEWLIDRYLKVVAFYQSDAFKKQFPNKKINPSVFVHEIKMAA